MIDESKPESAMVYLILQDAKAMIDQDRRNRRAEIIQTFSNCDPFIEAAFNFVGRMRRLPPRWHRL